MATRRRKVSWTPGARAALDDVLEYIAGDSFDCAQKVLRITLDLAASLETLAGRGRVVPEIGDPSVREVFVYSYRLIYHVHASEVRIIAFLHGAREFNPWWKNRS